MKRLGIRSKICKKFKITTDSKHKHEVRDNILNRDFSATALSQKWVSDLTYIKTKSGWLYLTVVIDLAGRKIIGWTFSNNMTATETTLKALKNDQHFMNSLDENEDLIYNLMNTLDLLSLRDLFWIDPRML